MSDVIKRRGKFPEVQQLDSEFDNLIFQINKKITELNALIAASTSTPGSGTQIQSDWNQADPLEVDYIKNKPSITSYTNEEAQDAVGNILDDGGDIDFTYDDVTPKITAIVKASTITEAKMLLVDNTTNDVSIAKHGLAPKAPNDTTKFLRGDGTWGVPSGGGGTKSLWLDPACFVQRTGATLAKDTANGRIIWWIFSGTVNWQILTTFQVPSDYASGAITVKYYWANAGSGGNNVVWNIIYHELAAGVDAQSTASEINASETFAPSTTQYAVIVSTLAQTITPSAKEKLITLMVQRVATDAADTNSTAMYLIGVELIYTAS